VIPGLAVVIMAIGSMVPACLDPTEIQVHIKTDSCSTLKSVEVYVGSSDDALANAPSAVARSCEDTAAGKVGSVTLVPSTGIGDKVSVAFVATLVGGSCTPSSSNDTSCIIARRDFRFIPHGKQDLTVDLDGVCAGKVCPVDQTCEPQNGQGVCTSSCQVGCAEDAGGMSDVGVPSDVITVSDVTGTSCVTPPGQQPSPSQHVWQWSFPFPQPSNLQDDASQDTEAFANGVSTFPTETSAPCASYFEIGMYSQQLLKDQAPLTGAKHVAITTWYRAKPNVGAAIFTIGTSSTGTAHAGFNANGNLVVSAMYSTTPVNITDTAKATTDFNWHYLYVDVDASTGKLSAWRDGTMIGQVALPQATNFKNTGPLMAGANVDIDQTQLFAY